MLTMYAALRQCYRKKAFKTEQKAITRAESIRDLGGPAMYVYDCRNCGNFHLTKNPKAHKKTL